MIIIGLLYLKRSRISNIWIILGFLQLFFRCFVIFIKKLSFLRVTPEEVIRAEREGFDIIWPGSDNEENEEINQQIITTAQESQIPAVMQTLPQTSIQTYQQIQQQPQPPPQQESQQQTVITGNNSYHSSPNSYNSANSSPRETTPQLHKRSQMIKSNSLSDYNLYNNGK